MPNPINAWVSEKILGAEITAQIAYFMPPKKAIQISRHYSLGFKAQLAKIMHPKKIEPILKEMPIEELEKVMRKLMEEKAYRVLGEYVEALPMEKLLILAKKMRFEELLFVSLYVKDKKRVAEIAKKLFSLEELREVYQISKELSLEKEMEKVLAHFPPSLREKILEK